MSFFSVLHRYKKLAALTAVYSAAVAMFGMTGCGSSSPATSTPTPPGTRVPKIYVADFGHDRIVEIDPNTTPSTYQYLSANPRNTADSLKSPSGIFVDNSGAIYIADSQNRRIVRVDDISGRNWTTTAIGGILSQPRGVWVDQGKIYIIDDIKDRLYRLNDMSDVNPAVYGANSSSNPTVLIDPMALCISGSFIYIADPGAHRIVRLNKDNWNVRDNWDDSSAFSNVRGIFVTQQGALYATEDKAVVVLKSATWKSSIETTTGPTSYKFASGRGIDVDKAGRIYVAIQFNDFVARMDGINLANFNAWGKNGTAGQTGVTFSNPYGIFVKEP